MPYPNVGNVFLVRRMEAGVECLEFAWTADASGEATLNAVPLEGTLERLWSKRTRDAGGAATHAVTVLDCLDDDVLLGLAASIADDATIGTETTLYFGIDADRRVPIDVVGRHTFRVTGATAGDAGLERLYVRCG